MQFHSNILLFLIAHLISFSTISQHQVGHYTITFQDPDRGNRAIETEIYYPSISKGYTIDLFKEFNVFDGGVTINEIIF